ncbi:MAG: hypothetical protein AB7V16_13830 [Vulcanibacillus sp.]
MNKDHTFSNFKKNSVSIIIVISPISSLYLGHLIRMINTSTDSIIVFEIYNRQLIKTSNGYQYRGFIYNNALERLYKYYLASMEIKNIISSYCSTVVYFAHPMHLVTNFVARLCNKHNNTICIIPDGVLNYYDCKPIFYSKEIIVKKIISPLLLLGNFKFNDNFMCFGMYNYEKIYALSLNYLNAPPNLKRELLTLPRQTHIPPEPKGVIIGQPINSRPEHEYKIIIQNMLKLLKSYNINQVLYKSHPREVLSHSFKDFIYSLNINICDDTEVIEMTCYKYTHFISTTSSALANIKIINKQATCISLFDKNNKIDLKTANNLKTYFKSLGVIIHEDFH